MAPPSNLIPDIERNVLGAAVLDGVACGQLVSTFPSERFVLPEHRALAETIEALYAQGHPVTQAGLVAAGANASVVLSCVTSEAQRSAVPYHVLLLTEAHLAREVQRVLRLASRDADRAVEGTLDVFEIVEQTQRAISDAQLSAEQAGRAETHIRHAVAEAFERAAGWREGATTDFASSGFYSLDKIVGGFPVGELTSLAAMTGAGKTSLLGQSVISVALAELAKAEAAGDKPAPVVVFSAEMSREQITHRIASAYSGINLRLLRSAKATHEQIATYEDALAKLATLEIHLDDEPAPTFAHIAARLHQIRQTAPGQRIALVGVDYDEKVHTEGASEELRVSAIARGLKDMAKRFNVPVLGLSQYSRAANSETLPEDRWLRYSGKKEHESAMIIHWMWPAYWVDKGVAEDKVLEYDPDRPERGFLVVTKNRFGPVGRVKLDFNQATTSFRDPDEPGQRYSPAELARRPSAPRSAAAPTDREMERERRAFETDGPPPVTDDLF